MISINNLSVQFTGTNLFDNVTFNINDRDRIGLVGKNGAGKSTLLKIIAGIQQPETGTIVVAKDQTVGYLPQEMIPNSSKTIIAEALTAFEQIDYLEDELQRLAIEIANRTDYESKEYELLLNKHHDISERILLLGGNNRREQTEKVLLGLGFLHSDFERSITEFSSGWQMRVELAKILLKHPDFILLDEPTNHLDIESIQWLENFLSSYVGAVILVSHDRTFLDNITKRTIEITAGKIYDYKASYSDYVILMEERRSSQMSALNNQQKEIAQIQSFIERFRYKATKAKQVQSRVKMLEKMDKISIDEVSTESIHFQFPPAPHSGKVVVEAEHLCKAYGDKEILNDLNFLLPKGSKTAFVGRNGEGKSTLAKIIIGEIGDYSGTFKLGHQVTIGYFAQNQAALLDGEKTVFDTIDQIAVGDIRPKIRNILGSFLFDEDDIEKKVKVLSGGEKARLALAKLLLTPCNLLVLDEPTNHLDMNSKDILKNALLQYTGTLIVVSHDRDFLQGLTDSLFEFRNKSIKEFKGDIFEFLEYRKIENLKALELQKKASPDKGNATVSQNKLNYEQSKQRERDLRKLRSAVEKIEKEIESTEMAIAEKDELLSSNPELTVSDPNFYSEYETLKQKLDTLMEDWEKATENLENF
ncbi:MAG: ABC-F family ATP-binding cassette domain-containing protein [Bacteroidales bacterium]|nr:ABC-F family ATP-binding cassette domain-containing protein [Bacteroidales bacterium]